MKLIRSAQPPSPDHQDKMRQRFRGRVGVCWFRTRESTEWASSTEIKLMRFCTRPLSLWVFCCWVGTVYNESLLHGVCQATRASCSLPPPPSSALSRRWVIRQSKIGFVYVLRLSSRQITPPAHCASECQTTYKECNSLYSAVDSSRPVQQRSMERFSTPLGCYSCGYHWPE